MVGAAPPETYKTFQKGQVIFREGQVNSVAYMVKKGAVRLFRVVNNRKVVISRMLPGQIFGEMALITGDPSNATAEAEVHSELIAFDRTLFQSLLLKSPNPVQRIVRHLMEQLRSLHELVQERAYKDLFLSVCQLLELHAQAMGQVPVDEQRSAIKNAVSFADFCRIAKTVLLVPQYEIDDVVQRLEAAGLITVRYVKGATYKKNILGQVSKASEYLHDRIIVIPDMVGFMTAARDLRREMEGEEGAAHGTDLDYIDIHDLAERAGTEPGIIYRLICRKEIPEGMICFPSEVVDAWLERVEDSFFDLAAPLRGDSRIMVVDEIVDVNDATLQLAFAQLGQQKIVVLYAAAGPRAKTKIMANVSKKMARILLEEAWDLRVDISQVEAVEAELSSILDKLQT